MKYQVRLSEKAEHDVDQALRWFHEQRELLFGRRRGTYRILFQIEGRRVQILRIRHTARDALKEDDL